MDDEKLAIEVRRLRLEPGDRIVLSLEYDATPEDAQALSRAARAMFPEHEVVVLSKGTELEVVSGADVRAIAREEIASLCGLVLRRSQDVEEIARRTGTEGDAELLPGAIVASIFGEAMRDFGATTSEPGPKGDA